MSAPYVVNGLSVTLTQAQAEDVVRQMEARKAQPVVGQVYRHRETTDEKPFDTAIPSPYTNWMLLRYDGNNRWSSQSITRRGQWDNYGTSSPMTIAVQKGDWVPYAPPVISNATHAGRRVTMTMSRRHTHGIVVEPFVAKRVHDYNDTRCVCIQDGTGKYYAMLQGELNLLD